MKTQAIKIQIVTGDARPIFKQIVDGIRMLIAKEELQEGTKLPSVRALAMQLGINPNTVAKAYSELGNQGVLESQQGLGIFVKKRSQILSLAERKKRLETALNTFINAVIYLDFPAEEISDRVLQRLNHLVKDPKEKDG